MPRGGATPSPRIGDPADVEKVVLARDVEARTAEPGRPALAAGPARRRYPACWTFSVDGLVGATPELLVRREKGLVTSRVLAGTIRRTGDDDADLALAAITGQSSKDLEEHEYAVRSVAEALAPHCSSTNVPDLQRGRSALQLLLPEGKLLLESLALEPVSLPGREIGVLDGQLGQRRGQAVREGLVPVDTSLARTSLDHASVFI